MSWPPGGGPPTAIAWGAPGDVPVPADFDGDAKADLAVYRPSTGTWFVRPSSGGPATATAWGAPGDVPVPGDYDGDTKADVAAYRPSTGTWFVQGLRRATTGSVVPSALSWGTQGDQPAPLPAAIAQAFFP